MDYKRILLLLAFVAVSVGIAFGLYFVFFRGAPPVDTVNNVNGGVNAGVNGGLPPAANGNVPIDTNVNRGELPPSVVSPTANGGLTQVTPVAPVATVGASVSSSGQLSYYNRADGKFYRLDGAGNSVALSNQTFYSVSNAQFDASGNKAIIEYPDGANVIYDFATNTQVTLPKHWEDFDFNPSGSQIVAKSVGIDPDARFLVTANVDGSGARPFQELGENQNKVQVAWSPNNEILATSTTGRTLDVDKQEVYFLGQYGQNFKSMFVEGLGFQPAWAPSGQQLVYSVSGDSSDWKPQLWIVDAQGDNIGRNRRSLNVNTWAEKCTFADDSTMYCAVPNELPRGAGLQPGVADGTPDTIYRINLTTGLQTVVAVPEGTHAVEKLMLTPDRRALYFTDKGTGLLNKIDL